MVELLVAVVFLAVCTSAILGCVWATESRGNYATHEAAVLAYLQDTLEEVRSTARTAVPATGTFVTNPVLSSVHEPVTVTTVIALKPGYANLYTVTITADWNERNFRNVRADRMTISTFVRAPDA